MSGIFSAFQTWSRSDFQSDDNRHTPVPETNFNYGSLNPIEPKTANDASLFSIGNLGFESRTSMASDDSLYSLNGQDSSSSKNYDRSIMLDRSLPVLVTNGMNMRDLCSAIYGGHFPLAAICELNGLSPDIVSVDSGEQIIEPAFSTGRAYRLPASTDIEKLTEMFWKRMVCGYDDEKDYIDIPLMPVDLKPPICQIPEKPPTCPPREKPPTCPPPEKPPTCPPPEKPPTCPPPEKPPTCPPPEKPPTCPPPEKPPTCPPPEKPPTCPPPEKPPTCPPPEKPPERPSPDKPPEKPPVCFPPGGQKGPPPKKDEPKSGDGPKEPENKDKLKSGEQPKKPEHKDKPKPADPAKEPEHKEQPKQADPPKASEPKAPETKAPEQKKPEQKESERKEPEHKEQSKPADPPKEEHHDKPWSESKKG